MRFSARGSPLLLTVAACSQPAAIEVQDVWARDTVGRTATAAVFMTIESRAPDRLIGASSTAAEKTDLMTMASESSSTQMKYVDAIDIPAGKKISLDPSGLHIWLAGLRQPLKTGQTFSLTLKFARSGERQVKVSVIAPWGVPPP